MGLYPLHDRRPRPGVDEHQVMIERDGARTVRVTEGHDLHRQERRDCSGTLWQSVFEGRDGLPLDKYS